MSRRTRRRERRTLKSKARREAAEFAVDTGGEIVSEAAFSLLGRIITFPFRILFRALDGL
ncbi:hypothetical protein GCM10027589_18430 [Actinocorallia lasiicapitis]